MKHVDGADEPPLGRAWPGAGPLVCMDSLAFGSRKCCGHQGRAGPTVCCRLFLLRSAEGCQQRWKYLQASFLMTQICRSDFGKGC